MNVLSFFYGDRQAIAQNIIWLSTQSNQTWTTIVLGDKKRDEMLKLLLLVGIKSLTEKASTSSKLEEESYSNLCARKLSST